MDKIRVGVVGAGVMGAGVAQSLAQNGFRVVLVDRDEAAIARARTEIRRNVRMQRLLSSDTPCVAPGDVMEAIDFTTRLRDLLCVSYVIENVTESFEIKSEVYPDIDVICTEEVIFAANTSAIPISDLAALTNRPDRVIGIHFMNPVPLKPVVELIRSASTSDTTVATTEALLNDLGKQAIHVADSPGFVSNRVLMLTINEAISVLEEKVASASDVDRIFRGCFGHTMGPIETADLIGLDTILQSIRVLRESTGDAKFEPAPLLVEMVESGRLGRKSGSGFFNYASV